MSTIAGMNGDAVNMSAAQVGNGVATNVVARRRYDLPLSRASMMRIVTTVGATPTCTYFIEGSANQVDWWPLPNIDLATVGTLVDATFTIVVAGTMWRMIPVDIPWSFMRMTYSANTNVTNTTDVFVY